MHRLQFIVPVRIAPETGGPITEIYGVEDALDFLQDWPAGRQGPVYQAAFNACFGALVDVVATEDAWKAFAGFCRISGVTAREMVLTPVAGAAQRPAVH